MLLWSATCGLIVSEALETDLFPLAFGFNDVDVGMRCDIAAAAATDRMFSWLSFIIAFNKEVRDLWRAQLPCRVDFNHVIALAITAPDLSVIDESHYDSFTDFSCLRWRIIRGLLIFAR